MQQGYIRGRLVNWDGTIWRWADTGEPAEGWGGAIRPCPRCGLTPELSSDPDAIGPDPCIGIIPGATGACCGHGVHVGYVTWPGIPAPAGWLRRAYCPDLANQERCSDGRSNE